MYLIHCISTLLNIPQIGIEKILFAQVQNSAMNGREIELDHIGNNQMMMLVFGCVLILTTVRNRMVLF